MKTLARPLAAALAACLASAATAGPLDKSKVPADAAWVVHLDVEAALRCRIARAFLDARGDARIEGLDRIDGLKQELGIDPLNDIKGVTVFGAQSDGADAVAVVSTTAAVDDVIDRLRAKGHDCARVVEGAYELCEWVDEDESQKQYSLIRDAGENDRLVYLSKDKALLAAAAAVADGRGESLAGRGGSALAAEPGAGAILFIASDIIPRHGHDDEVSMVFEKARAVRFEMGEAGNDLYADLDLKMASSEDATNVVQVLQGLKAMGRMFCQSNPDLSCVKDLLDAQTLAAKDATIGAHLRYPTAKLIDAIKAAEQRGKEPDEGRAATPKEGKHGGHGKKPL